MYKNWANDLHSDYISKEDNIEDLQNTKDKKKSEKMAFDSTDSISIESIDVESSNLEIKDVKIPRNSNENLSENLREFPNDIQEFNSLNDQVNIATAMKKSGMVLENVIANKKNEKDDDDKKYRENLKRKLGAT